MEAVQINIFSAFLLKYSTRDTDTISRKRIFYQQKEKNTKERDDTMAAITKPSNGAFVLKSKKVSEFLGKKANTSSDALKRFDAKKPKDGIVTPFKK